MTSFTLTVQEQGVSTTLTALTGRVEKMQPTLQAIGEDVVEHAKHRFETSTGPDGVLWKLNSAATLAMLFARLARATGKRTAHSIRRATPAWQERSH